MRVFFEKVDRPTGTSFACSKFRDLVFDCPYHQHPEIELLHIEKSSGRTVIGDSPGVFRPDQFYLFAANLPHLFCNMPTMDSDCQEARSRVVQFLPDCLGVGFWDLPENHRIARLLRNSARGILWEGSSAKRAAHLLDRVFAARTTHRIARLLDLLAFLASAPDGKSLASAGYRPVSNHAVSERLESVLRYVHGNLTEEISAEKASQLAGLSLSGFGRLFRRFIGRPFMDYVIELRISEARRLLVGTDLTVAEICFRCGFGNLSNFNRHFLSRCGQAPAAWRRSTVSQNNFRTGARFSSSEGS